MFNNREEETKREKDRERKAKYAFFASSNYGTRFSPAQVIPDWNLRCSPLPKTLLPVQPVRTLGKGMPQPVAPHKSMPNLWPVGTLEDGLSPGTPWHPWGGPHLPDLESGLSTGMP